MTFGKLTDGRLTLCPKQGRDGKGKMHTNLPKYYEKAADRDGWMEVVYTDKPEGNYRDTWEQSEGRIVQVWTAFTPEPEPVDPYAERFDFIEDCLLEISEKLWN